MPDFNCYIDESGDEGIGTGGTRWFVLGAVIVPAEEDLTLSNAIPYIKRRLGKDETKYVLHWRKMKHDVKLYVAQTLSAFPITFSAVVVDKEAEIIKNSSILKTKDTLYFYAARYLIERLSWLSRDSGRIAKLTFEHRSSLDYDELRTYWRHLRFLVTEVYWRAIDWNNFKVLPKHLSRWLQAADSYCGAISDGLEKNRFGNVEPSYIMALRDRIYRRRGNLFSYGLKFMPTTALKKAKTDFDWLTRI